MVSIFADRRRPAATGGPLGARAHVTSAFLSRGTRSVDHRGVTEGERTRTGATRGSTRREWWGPARYAAVTGGLWLLAVSLLTSLGRDVPGWLSITAVVVGAVGVVTGQLIDPLPPVRGGETRSLPRPTGGRWLPMDGSERSQRLLFAPLDHVAPSGVRPADEFPGFRQPVRSPVAGTVVSAHHSSRDHRSRDRRLAVVEHWFRSRLGDILHYGNHVVIETDDHEFLLLGHLQRGSVTVPIGTRVEVGDVIGRCGNSGSSAEPHVLVQLMDRRHAASAHGIPFVLDGRVALSDRDLDVADGRHGSSGLPAERTVRGEVLGMVDAVRPDGQHQRGGVVAATADEVPGTFDHGALEVPERMVAARRGDGHP